MLYVWPTTPVV